MHLWCTQHRAGFAVPWRFASGCSWLTGAQARNVHKMELVEGHGNEFVGGRAREGDAINRVYVVDSDELPFHQAEARLPYSVFLVVL